MIMDLFEDRKGHAAEGRGLFPLLQSRVELYGEEVPDGRKVIVGALNRRRLHREGTSSALTRYERMTDNAMVYSRRSTTSLRALALDDGSIALVPARSFNWGKAGQALDCISNIKSYSTTIDRRR